MESNQSPAQSPMKILIELVRKNYSQLTEAREMFEFLANHPQVARGILEQQREQDKAMTDSDDEE